MQLLFVLCGLFLVGSESESVSFINTIPGQRHVKKKILVPALTSFAVIDSKEHFRKILTNFFEFDCCSQ